MGELVIWVMVWIVCTGTVCYRETIQQEFPDAPACEYALAFYQARDAVIGTCQRHEEEAPDA
jgi:hypothetical protein